MAVQATGQITLIDLTDARVAQLSLESSGPQVQVFESPSNSYSPDYSVNNITITPKLYLGNNLQTIEWTNIEYHISGGEEKIILTSSNSKDELGFELTSDAKLIISKNIPASQDRYYIQAKVNSFIDENTGLEQKDITASIEFTLLQSSGTFIPKVSLEADSLISFEEEEGSYNPSTINLLATVEGFDFEQTYGVWYKNDTSLEEVNFTEDTITYSKEIIVSNDTLPATYYFRVFNKSDDEQLAADQVTLVILRNGKDGEDGSAVNLLVSNEMTNVSCFVYDDPDLGEVFQARTAGTIESSISLYQGIQQINLKQEGAKVTLGQNIFYYSPEVPFPYLSFSATIEETGSISIVGEYPSPEAEVEGEIVDILFKAGTLPITITLGENTYKTAISWVPVTGGQDGQDSVYVKLIPSNGIILTESNSFTVLSASVYRGGQLTTEGVSGYKWYSLGQDPNGVSVVANSTFLVRREELTNIKTIICEVSLSSGSKISDQITIMDKTDPITSEIVCSLGDKFVNGIIPKTAVLTCNLYKGNSSYTPPSGTIYRWLKIEDEDKNNELEIIPVKESEDNFYQIENNKNNENNEIIDNQKIIYQCEVILPTTVSTVETIE